MLELPALVLKRDVDDSLSSAAAVTPPLAEEPSVEPAYEDKVNLIPLDDLKSIDGWLACPFCEPFA